MIAALCHQSERREQMAKLKPSMAPGIIAPREWPNEPRIPQPEAMTTVQTTKSKPS